MGRSVKRLLIVLGVLVAAAPFWVALWIAFDEGGKLLHEPEPPPAAPPKPKRRVEVPAAETPVTKLLKGMKSANGSIPTREALGELVVEVTGKYVEGEQVDGSAVRLTVLYPTGQQLATQSTTRKGEVRFSGLPHEVPLVVRVEAPGFLTGYCCDVLLEPKRVARKSIELRLAPRVTIRVVDAEKDVLVAGARVELRRGDEVVDFDTTNDDGEAILISPILGAVTVRAESERLSASREKSIDVWPGLGAGVQEIALSRGGDVAIQVLTASGEPAPGVDVWLVGEANSPPLVRTDSRGIAAFRSVSPGLKLTAIARASDGSVASAAVSTEAGTSNRVAVLLGRPGPLTGDVVDQGGNAIAGAAVEVRIRPFGEPVTVTSDDTGRFETPPLPSGLAEVTVRRDGFVEWRSTGVVVIDPAVGGKLRAHLSRLPVGDAWVVVKDEAGRPLEGALVKLYPSGRSGKSGDDGRCRFENLPAGVEQAVFARRRGFRARGPSSAGPAVILTRADVAQSAEVTLVATPEVPADAGPCSIKGVLLRPDRSPVQGALVEAGPWCTGTASDGSFLLEGVKPTTPGEPLEFRVSMLPWPLERIRFLVDVENPGVLDFGSVLLASQPYAMIDVPLWRSKKGDSAVSAFWLSTNHGETFLGRTTGRFEPVPCVSYDGRWLHLPPPDDWRTDGRGEVFLGFPTPRGFVTATAAWTLRPNAAEKLHPVPRSRTGSLDVSSPMSDRTDAPLIFRQITCDTMFDPKSIHVPTGDDQPPIDPFASLATLRTFILAKGTTKARVDDLAPGRWRVSCGRDLIGEANVPEESRVRLGK